MLSAMRTRRPSGLVDHLRWVALLLSILLLGVASLLPTGGFRAESGAPVEWAGHTFLLCGWAGPLQRLTIVGWYANPLLWTSWIVLALRRYVASAFLLLIALCFAVSSVTLFGAEIYQNEGGVNNLQLRAFLPGFYVWLAAFVVPFGFSALAGLVELRR